MSEYWFTADTHFGHKNIIAYTNRPFSGVEEMEEEMVRRWNECVAPGDIVFHLGDFGFFKTPQEGVEILKRLNGQVTLLKGNHDSSRLIKRMGFTDIHRLLTWRIPPKKVRQITMCHYPMLMWRDSHLMEWHAHGHSHGLLPESSDRLSIDVGVDCWDFYPVHLDELYKKFEKKEKGWRSLVMKHDRPHGSTKNGFKLYALLIMTGQNVKRWVEDLGDKWMFQSGDWISKVEDDMVECYVWATSFANIAERLPKGGAKGIMIPGRE